MPIPQSLFPAYPEAYRQWENAILPKLQKGHHKQAIKAAQDLAKEAKVNLRHEALTAKQHAKLIASEDFPPNAMAIFLADLAKPNNTAIKTIPESATDTHAIAHEVHHALVNLSDPKARMAITGPEGECANFMIEAANNLLWQVGHLFPLDKASNKAWDASLPVKNLAKAQLDETAKALTKAGDQAYRALKRLPLPDAVERAKAYYTNEVQAYGACSLHKNQIPGITDKRAATDEQFTNAFAMAYRALEAAEKRATGLNVST